MSDDFNRDEPRVLEYRRQLKISATLLKYFVFCLFLFFIGILSVYLYTLIRGGKLIELQVSSVGVGLTWLILYLEYNFIFKPLATSNIQVFNDRLLIRRGKKEITVPFNEIVTIKTAVMKNVGGWFKLVLKNGKSYRFTIVLERADYIIDAIIAFNPKLMDQEKYFNLRTKLILTDHAIARVYSLYGKKYRWITLAHSVILPTIVVTLLISQQEQVMMLRNWWEFYLNSLFKVYFSIWVLGVAALSFINLIVGKTIKLRLRQDPANKIRDTNLESSIYRKVFPAYLLSLFGVLAMIYQYDLNTLSWTHFGNAFPHLNVQKNETLWIDMRFNCVKCAYSLRQGDKVIFKHYGLPALGQLVGFPGDIVQVNNIGSDGRSIASTQAQTIPENKVAIRVNPDGSAVRLVDISALSGRATTELLNFIAPSKQ